MSAGQDQGPNRGRDSRELGREPGLARLGLLPRPLALAALVIWALATIAALVGLLGAASPWSGAIDGLVPVSERAEPGRSLILVRVDHDALAKLDPEDAEAQTDPGVILAEAGFAIEEAFPDERVPLAPPRTEITRWLDAHALYLLPIEAHPALAERLSDAQMLAQVQGLHARLSSPLFAVSGEQPRRDPLAVHELTSREAGRLGHVAEVPGSDAAQVSPSGDLLAARGDLALMGLVSDRPVAELEAELEAALASSPVSAALIDPRTGAREREAQLSDAWLGLVIACLAGVVLLAALVVREVVPVVVMVLGLGSAWVLMIQLASVLELGGVIGIEGIDLASLALSLVLIGHGVEASLQLAKRELGRQGLATTLIMATALAPLALTPYPIGQRWAAWWALAFVIEALIAKLVVPALLELGRAKLDWRGGASLPQKPGLALLVCLGLGGAGIYVAPELPYRSLARPPLASTAQRELEDELREHFFDPSMIVEARTPAPDPEARPAELTTPAAAALDAAAETTAQLAALVPAEARRVDSPGSFVLPAAELDARRKALAKLNLLARMEVLDALLADQGLRAEAFAEFVRGAADIDDLPSAAAALDGPLGPWISAYLSEGDEVELHTRVELRGREGLASAPLSAERQAELPALHGPAMAAMADQEAFWSRLGLAVIAGLWLIALFVWLASADLGAAIAVAIVALACESGVLLGLHLLGLACDPHLIAVLLLVGAGAGVIGARACQAVRDKASMSVRALLLVGAAALVPALVLLTSSQPLWRELGLALAIGSVLACVLGPFATPGLAALLGRRAGPRPKPKGDSSDG